MYAVQIILYSGACVQLEKEWKNQLKCPTGLGMRQLLQWHTG